MASLCQTPLICTPGKLSGAEKFTKNCFFYRQKTEGATAHKRSAFRYALLAIGFALASLFSHAAPASANNCLQDEYSLTASQKLNCTANDVRVAKVVNVRDLSGNKLTSCISGSNFNFIADFLVQTSSQSSRSNIGLYFATAGATQTNALSGQCSDNIIPPTHACAGSSVSCGSTHYDELDPSPDNCGDSSSSDPTVCLDANNNVVSCPAPPGGSTFTGTQVVTVEIDNFNCSAPAGTNQLVLPNCTSWQVPGSTIQCVASAPSYPYPTSPPEAIPGSPSKCNCSTLPLPITVQSPSATVAKTCDVGAGGTNNNPNALCTASGSPFACCTGAGTGSSTGSCGATSCTLAPEGGSVKYTVDIGNQSNFGSIIVDQICDSAYGTVVTTTGSPACPAGTAGSVGSTTCTSGLTVNQGSHVTCTFTVSQAESKSISDTLSVTGHGSSAGSFGPTSSNTATVGSGEATTTATITKSLVNTTNGCVTVRYGVDVADKSAAGTDETLSLSGLSDDGFGSITQVQGSVLGTTCGVATTSGGLGSLSGSKGAGAFPATIAVGGDYTCQFDAQFCGSLVPIVSVPGTCTSGTCTTGKTGSCSSNSDCDVTCTGIHHTNRVTGTLTGDEGAGDVVSATANSLTVSQCFPAAISSSSP